MHGTLDDARVAHYIMAMDPTSLDWIRYVEAPVMIALAGALLKHVMWDHKVEIDLRAKLAKLEGYLEAIDKFLGGKHVRRTGYSDDDRD